MVLFFFFFAGSVRLDLYFPRGDSLATDFPQGPEKKSVQQKVKSPLSGFPGLSNHPRAGIRQGSRMASTVWIIRAFPRALVETHLGCSTIGVSTDDEKGKSRGERAGRVLPQEGETSTKWASVDMGVWAVPPWEWCVEVDELRTAPRNWQKLADL